MPADTALVDETNVTPENTEAQNQASSEVNGEAVDGVDREDLDLGYQVSLDSFSGPLDLLLYLVRRSEVDITDIPIAQIADQFLATLQSWDNMDLDIAGDFILMAASLLEIKARLIVPSDEEQQDEEEDFIDPRDELIQQLLQFRKFKEATQLLQHMEDNKLLVHHRRVSEHIPEAEDQADYNLENADAYQLFVLWDQTLVSIAGKRPRTVVYDDIPIEQRVKQVLSTMQTALEGQLNWLFASVETRIQRIGVFVAVLECVRKKFLEVIQHEQYGSVYLRYREDDERAAKAVLPPDIADEGDKPKRRRRKRQLVTYRAPETTEGSEDNEADDAVQSEMEFAEDEDLQVETDEQRFLRELNDATAVDNLLAIGKDLDAALESHLYEQGVLEAVEEAEDVLDSDDDAYDDEDEDDDDDGRSLIDLADDDEAVEAADADGELDAADSAEDYAEDEDYDDEDDEEEYEDDEDEAEDYSEADESEDEYLEDEDEYDDDEDEYDDDDEFDDEDDEDED